MFWTHCGLRTNVEECSQVCVGVSACLPTCKQTCNNMQYLHPATVLLIVKQTRADVINN